MIRAAGCVIGFTLAAIVLLVLALAALVAHGIAWAIGHRPPAPPARPSPRDWQPPAGDLAAFYSSGAADRHLV